MNLSIQSYAYSLVIINLCLYLLRLCYPKEIAVDKKAIIIILLSFLINNIKIFHGLALTSFLNGCFSDISIATIILMQVTLITFLLHGKFKLDLFMSKKIAVLIVFLGIILYLSTLGIFTFDLYALGYSPSYLLIAIFGICLFMLWDKSFFAIIFLCGIIGFYFHLQTSNNLFDYVFDPFLWILAIYHYVAYGNFKGV